ncbi:MAG: PIN domain-containing protein [Desulfurococcales archaeon]|nr:PIN domain-containing protein [Desulfurococcales archaeon]
MKVVDTNIFVEYLFDGDRADEAERLLASYPDLAVTVGIIDEVEFVIIRRLAKKRLGIRKLSKVKEHIRKKGLDFAADMLERYTEMLREFDITVLRDHSEPKELLETMRKYRLTPSDAIIALSCKHYGIDTILTFDEDFKKIPWLKAIP